MNILRITIILLLINLKAHALIKVDITGYNSVTLEVDPGNDLDIADHADWADACFLQSLK